MNLLAYTYDADTHCIDCTNKKFRAGWPLVSFVNPTWSFSIFNQVDKGGNFVHALYDIDEWYELEDWYVQENPIQYLACGTCHGIIDTYEHELIMPATWQRNK